jgi:hypothetical protein
MKLLPALLILFIGLKLTGYIAWPWLWVTAPVWIPLGAAALFFAVVVIINVAFRAN